MVELPPEQFRFSNYDGGIIPTSIFLGGCSTLIAFLKQSIILGWAKSSSYKSREDQHAVMFLLDETEEYWCHVPDWAFEPFLESFNN